MVLNARVAYRYEPSAMPRNVCKQAVDTLCAKVAKHRPLPQCLTSRGNWKQQKRARKMTQFLEGCFYQTKVFEKYSAGWVRDAGVFGRGVLKVDRCGKKIGVERVHPWELLTDDWDARYGDPRSIYHVRTLDVGVAMALFGDTEEKRQSIADSAGSAPSDEWDWQGEVDATVSRVRIAEAWHLCPHEEEHEDTSSTEQKHDCGGRHVITVLGGEELLNEEWKETLFPFAVLNYSEPLAGYWGIGVCEILEGWQLAINEQFGKVQEGHHMLGGGMIFAVNHLSEFDPMVVAHFVYDAGRWPQFLAKSSLFKIVGFGPFLRAVRQIPVYRGTADAAKSLAAAADAIRAGDAVIIYPEGTTPKSGDLWPRRGKTGIARLYLATGVPVIPVVTWGAQDVLDPRTRKVRLRPRFPVTVVAGPPVDLAKWDGAEPTAANLYAITDQIMTVLRDMLAGIRGEPAPAADRRD